MAKVEARLVPEGAVRHLTLPREGWTEEAVRAELDTLAGLDHARWEDGFVSGAVYHGGDDLLRLQADAYARFSVSNPIHPDVFPGVRKMEAEVVASTFLLRLFRAVLEKTSVFPDPYLSPFPYEITDPVLVVLALFNAPPGAAGACTSGGTESILMACLSARQKAYAERGVTEPEM